jgi:steroid delta-isomerase-like uncharacterized protein
MFMSEENKALVCEFFTEVINAGNMASADEFVTTDYVEHQQLPGAEGRQGIEGARAFLSMMHSAFLDVHFDIEDLVAEGDRVVARVTVSGTHQGELIGLAPTGKRVRTPGIEVFRVERGKMAEHWAVFDALGMLRQLGLQPVPGPALLVRTLVYQVRRRLPAMCTACTAPARMPRSVA